MAQDLHNELGTLQVFKATNILVAAGTQTFAGVDIRDYVGKIKVMYSCFSPHAAATNEIIFDILDSADDSTYTANTNATPVTTTASAASGSISVDTRNFSRYIQGRVRITGTTSTYAACMMGAGLQAIT